MKILGTMFALLVSLGASTQAMAAVDGEGSGKGTIGIVCVDSSGDTHFWNSETRDDFESCVDQVVGAWVTEEAKSDSSSSAKRLGFDDLIEGIDSYRQSVTRNKAQPKGAK